MIDIIKKVSNENRGYGTMTCAMFSRKPSYHEGPWDYLEVIQSYEGEYQCGCAALENPKVLIGLTVQEVRNRWNVLRGGHFHRAEFDDDGNIIDLTS